MMGIPRIRVNAYIPEIPPSTRWVPRKSYQIGVRTAYPFDLEVASKRTTPRQIGRLERLLGRFIRRSKTIEEEFILPSIADFQGIYQEKSPFQWTYAPPISNSMKPFMQRAELLKIREEAPTYEIPDKHRHLLAIGHFSLIKGTLKRNEKGLFYIQFPKNLLSRLYPLLLKEGAIIPKFIHLKEDIGPHIPVILPKEDLTGLTEFNQIGEKFFLIVKNIGCKEVSDWSGVKKIWYLTFESPDLEAIRMRYGLMSHPLGQDFTCIIGLEPGHAKHTSSYYKTSTLCSPV